MSFFRILASSIIGNMLLLRYTERHVDAMAGIKDFFEMRRHERRGTIVVLALIAVLLAATAILRCCNDPVPVAQPFDIQQFEADIDSSAAVIKHTDKSSRPKHSRAKKKSQRKPSPAKPKPKPDHQPRRLDPVPQF